MNEAAVGHYKRITEVDRSSGLALPCPQLSEDASKTRLIYNRPAKDQPDDTVLSSSIDAAYAYLCARNEDKKLSNDDKLKAVLLGGIFIGMLFMAGIHHYIGAW